MISYHFDIFVESVEILHFSEADLEGPFGDVFGPDGGGVVFLVQNSVFGGQNHVGRTDEIVLQIKKPTSEARDRYPSLAIF